MDGYYGAASSKMNAYLKYLQERIDKDAGYRMVARSPYDLKYLDLNFFLTAEKLFGEAEARLKPGSLEMQHVQRERFIVDGALLQLWPWLDRKLAANAKMPFDHETLIRRYEANWRAHVKLYWHRFYSKAGRIDKLAALFRDPQWPGQFRNLPPRDVADFTWLTFSGWYSSPEMFVDDKEAAGEMALAFAGMKDEAHQKPLTFWVSGGAIVTLKPEAIPQDGRYHVYKIGRVNVKKWVSEKDRGTIVWAAIEDKKFRVNVGQLCVTNAQDCRVNDWDAYISLKVKGPAYVKGSTESNGVGIDRVLLVKPQPGEDVVHATELPP